MSHDFRRATHLSLGYKSGMGALPFVPRIDYVETDPMSNPFIAPAAAFWVPGEGDFRRVPAAIASLYFACEWEFSFSLAGGGLSRSWSGTLKRGILRDVDDEGFTETGVHRQTMGDAWSFYLDSGNPVPRDLDFYLPEAAWSESHIEEDFWAEMSVWLYAIGSTVYGPIYYAAADLWLTGTYGGVFGVGVAAHLTAKETLVSISTGVARDGVPVSGLTYAGIPWTLIGVDVVSFSGEITPTAWLV